jgi:hypothetical protein
MKRELSFEEGNGWRRREEPQTAIRPGVIDAYRIESRAAKYPRIVVDQKVLDELATNNNLWTHDRDDELNAVNRLLRKDEEDSLLYVKSMNGCSVITTRTLKALGG